MTNPGHRFGRLNDPRFTLHQLQPRADKLGTQQRKLCASDAAFSAALSKRVSDPARWEAFIEGTPDYTGQPCPRCSSTRRRTRDRSCYACKLKANAANFQRIRSRVSPVAGRSRAGYLDMLHRRRQEQAGEIAEFTVGGWTAKQYPTGRLAVSAAAAVVRGPGANEEPLPPLPSSPYLSTPTFGTQPVALAFDCPNLNDAHPAVVHGLASRNPDFLTLLQWASWA